MIAQYDRDAAIETERKAPELCTEAEIANVAIEFPDLARKIRVAKYKAVAPAVTPAAPVAKTAAATAEHPVIAFLIKRIDETDDVQKSLTEAAEKWPTTATPLMVTAALWAFAEQMNSKNIERNVRLNALEARLAGLEAAVQTKGAATSASDPLQAVRYRGVWGGEGRYEVDDCVTFQGSLWFCRQSGAGVKPGDGLVWQLGVKGR